ncbi:ParB/RepB/Spo0J family partition protein [Demequina aurantiaca]|uniref:ParB/RepB/Spo0J family partition protein n=1 Tax=Demequina aurantiaca TaxID=676200 RepID=UPI003D346DED
MSKPKRGLGRGLGALIPTEEASAQSGPRPSDVFFGDSGDASAAAPAGARAAGGSASSRSSEQGDLLPVPGARFAHIDPYSVVPNPRQPRTVFDEEALQELVGSIREIGVLQPIVVRTNPEGDGFELIMGERRLRASKEAGLKEIPAIVRETDDTDLLRDALVENLHRSQLNPLEEAAAYQQLLDDFGITHEQLAERISRSRPQISNTLRLLKLPPPVQRRLAAGVLSAGHARALLGLESPEAMDQLATRIVAEGLSVRATEEAVTLGVQLPPEKKGSVRSGGHTAALDELSARLGDHLDTRVKVQLGRARGKVTIDFATVEDLNRIVALIDPADPGVFK